MKKARLRSIARMKGDLSVLAAGQGQVRENMNDDDVKEVRTLFMEILEVNNLSQLSLDELMEVLKPDTLFERFAARKAN